MIWYINKTHENAWSRSMLITQFDLRAYERSLIEPIVTTKIKEPSDTYVLDFIDRYN